MNSKDQLHKTELIEATPACSYGSAYSLITLYLCPRWYVAEGKK